MLLWLLVSTISTISGDSTISTISGSRNCGKRRCFQNVKAFCWAAPRTCRRELLFISREAHRASILLSWVRSSFRSQVDRCAEPSRNCGNCGNCGNHRNCGNCGKCSQVHISCAWVSPALAIETCPTTYLKQNAVVLTRWTFQHRCLNSAQVHDSTISTISTIGKSSKLWKLWKFSKVHIACAWVSSRLQFKPVLQRIWNKMKLCSHDEPFSTDDWILLKCTVWFSTISTISPISGRLRTSIDLAPKWGPNSRK